MSINPADYDRCESWLHEIQNHLRDELLPFWLGNGHDDEHGGFLTYFDSEGAPTGEDVKTLICQTRMVYSYSALHRAGFGEGRCLELARDGVDFLLDHFWDHEHGGWYWTTARDGTPLNESKITYGHSFAMYGLSEYGMASGDFRGMEWAVRTYETVQSLAADNLNGGYYEFLERNWQPKPGGAKGGDRKSLDVHMHLMEAFTNLYEASGAEVYARKTREMIDLIFRHMIHPDHGTGIAQFSTDWKPLQAILFEDVWGADRDVEEDEGRPLDNTSYGHNVEFAWLLGHAVRILGLDDSEYADAMRILYDHCIAYGIDNEFGGVFCEGPGAGPARERNKEFWQQAETLIAMLDAYRLFGDTKYLDAYEKVHRFAMDVMINHDVGEWFPLFSERNERVWGHMASAWKINYHTVRSMIESESRLMKLLA